MNDENFEHHHRIKWRAPPLRPVRIGERCVQFRAKRLECHRRRECFELVTEIAQPLQSIIDIENPACLRIESSPIHPSQWYQKGSELARFLEASDCKRRRACRAARRAARIYRGGGKRCEWGRGHKGKGQTCRR